MKTDPPPNSVPDPQAAPKPAKPRGQVFDVMRPGKAPAPPTSRPVVIGHKAGAQAAQVRVSGIGAGGDNLLDAGQRHSVQPVAAGAAAGSPAEASQAPQQDPDSEAAAATMASATEAAPEPAKETAKPEPMEPAEALPATPDKLAEAAMEPEPPAPAPIESGSPQLHTAGHDSEPGDHLLHEMAPPSLDGQVVVSHHTTEPRGTGRLIGLIVLAVLFALIVLDILLDAGIIDNTTIPHTNFF